MYYVVMMGESNDTAEQDGRGNIKGETIDQSLAISRSIADLTLTPNQISSVSPDLNSMSYNPSTLGGVVSSFVFPIGYIEATQSRQPKQGEVSGKKPVQFQRKNRTFSVDEYVKRDFDYNRCFNVVNTHTTLAGEEAYLVDTPAPWQCPDDLTEANEVVKSLSTGWKWLSNKDQWSIHSEYISSLRRHALKAGYEWTVTRRKQPDKMCEHTIMAETSSEMVLRNVAKFVEVGDRVEINREGYDRLQQTNKGEVSRTNITDIDSRDAPENNSIKIQRDSDMRMYLRLNEDGKIGAFSTHDRHMGEVYDIKITPVDQW